MCESFSTMYKIEHDLGQGREKNAKCYSMNRQYIQRFYDKAQLVIQKRNTDCLLFSSLKLYGSNKR